MCKLVCYTLHYRTLYIHNFSGYEISGQSEVDTMYKVEVLEKKRLEKGLSYTEIAEKLGIHKVTVSRTLKGVTMKPRTVKLLADYLGVGMEGIVQ